MKGLCTIPIPISFFYSEFWKESFSLSFVAFKIKIFLDLKNQSWLTRTLKLYLQSRWRHMLTRKIMIFWKWDKRSIHLSATLEMWSITWALMSFPGWVLTPIGGLVFDYDKPYRVVNLRIYVRIIRFRWILLVTLITFIEKQVKKSFQITDSIDIVF